MLTAKAILVVMTMTQAPSDAHDLPHCFKPNPMSAAEYQQQCWKSGGTPELRASVFCQLPDGTWVHNDYLGCNQITGSNKSSK